MPGGDILIGVDAGTSVIKAVAFDLGGRQLGSASVPNKYASGADGSATQSLAETWADCAAALRRNSRCQDAQSSPQGGRPPSR